MNTWSPQTCRGAARAVDALRVRHEEVQQAELGRELDALSVSAHATRRWIEAQAFDLDRVPGELRRAPAQHR